MIGMFVKKRLSYIRILALALLLNSCVRVDDGMVVPDSLPYSFEKIADNTIYSEESYLNTYYDSTSKCDHLECFYTFPDSALHQDLIKAYCLFTKGNPIFDQDQITFKYSDYKDAERILRLPIRKDFNRNGNGDESFLVFYRDSIRLQIHDHKIESNIPYYTHTFTREDGHLVFFLGYWQPDDNTRYLMLRKSNRLVWEKSKSVDTNFFIDPGRNIIKAQPFGVAYLPINIPLENYDYYDEYLYCQNGISKNRHDYNGLTDYNSYLFKMDKDLNILWLDTLYKAGSPENVLFLYKQASGDVLVGYQDYSGNNNCNIFKYDGRTGIKNITDTIKFHPEQEQYTIYLNDSIYIIQKNLVKIYNENFKLLSEGDFPAPIVLIYSHIGLHEVLPIFKRARPKVDINHNGSLDFLLTIGRNQLAFIDGKDFEILAATQPFENALKYCVSRNQNADCNVTVIDGLRTITYGITETPFETMIKPHLTLALIFLLAILGIPPLGYSIYKIIYFRKLYSILSSGSDTQGIAIIKKVVNGNYKTYKTNSNFKQIINSHDTQGQRYEIPAQLMELARTAANEGKDKTFELNYGKDAGKYLIAHISMMRFLGRISYCVLTIVDTTDMVKSEVLSLAISIAHDAKNELSEVQTRFENLMYAVKEGGELDNQWLEKSEEKISQSIYEVSGTLKKLLFAGDMPKTQYVESSLKELIDNWIELRGGRYRRRNIELSNHVDPGLPPISIDSRHMGFLFQCACDNSSNAIPKETDDGSIEFHSEQADGLIILNITDNGKGIPEEELQKINSGYNTSKSEAGGLGMKIIKRVCEAHNAEYIMSSIPENGATLSIQFDITKKEQ